MSQSAASAETYRHTQFGTLSFAIFCLSLIGCLAVGMMVGWPLALLIAVIPLAFALVLFHSLTAVVTSEHLRIFFGPGLISRTIPLNTIRSAEPGRSHWLWGWGIRFWPGRGWMWNISGFDVVVLTYADGREFRVGTDDSAGLADAIRGAKTVAG